VKTGAMQCGGGYTVLLLVWPGSPVF